MRNRLLVGFVLGLFLASSTQASWIIVNSDGSKEKLNNCCPKKYVKKVVVEPEFCETCDYSKFKDAVLFPVGDEKLKPAALKDCD